MPMVWKHDTGSFLLIFLFFFLMDIFDKTFGRHQKSASNLIRWDL